MIRSLVRRRLWATCLVALLIASGIPATCRCPATNLEARGACHPTPTCCDPASTPSVKAPPACCDSATADTTTTLSTDSAMPGHESVQHAVGLAAPHSRERLSHPALAIQCRTPRQVVLRI